MSPKPFAVPPSVQVHIKRSYRTKTGINRTLEILMISSTFQLLLKVERIEGMFDFLRRERNACSQADQKRNQRNPDLHFRLQFQPGSV
jgi:hypothetical protein